jgi:fructoselysine-6-P-deglycase FrlB-like protein
MVVAVTNRPEEPVGTLADAVLPLLAGDETAGIACRTYAATVAVLALLGDRISGDAHEGDRFRPAADAVQELLEGRAAWVDEVADDLDRAPGIDVVAPARHLGVAEQAALMLREAPRLDAHAHETGDWLHTAIYTSLPGHRALLIPGSPRDEDVVRTVRERGGTTTQLGAGTGSNGAIPIPPPGDLPDGAWPLVTSTVAELLAATLWQRTGATLKVP